MSPPVVRGFRVPGPEQHSKVEASTKNPSQAQLEVRMECESLPTQILKETMADVILLMVLVINGAVIPGGGRHCEGGDGTDNLGSGGPGDGSVDVSSSSDDAQITVMVETAVMMVLMKTREIALMTVVAAGMTTMMAGWGVLVMEVVEDANLSPLS